MTHDALPPALRSRLQLMQTTSADCLEGAQSPPLTLCGTTYTMAQEVSAVDDEHFAVGRWDGSLEIFAFTAGAGQAPIMNCAVNSPAERGAAA